MKYKYFVVLILSGFFLNSCQKDNQTISPDSTAIEAGKGRLKINLSGSDYADIKSNKSEIQNQEIELGSGIKAFVSLERIDRQSTVVKRAANRMATAVEKGLPNETYYGILTYNGNSPSVKTLQVGGANQSIDLAPGTHEVILYSRGLKNETTLNTINWGPKGFYDVSAKDGAFMATTKTLQIKAGEETAINATLIHQFSEININVKLPSTVATAVTGSISTSKINYKPFENPTVDFQSDGNQNFTLVAAGATASGKVIVGGNTPRDLTLNVGGKTITVPNVRVIPGERYNLNINLVSDNEIIKVPTGTHTPGESIVLYEKDLSSTNGFEIDITDLDNSFAVEVNGKQVFTADIASNGIDNQFEYHDMQFQGRETGELVAYQNKAYPANIKFADGSVWGSNGVSSIWSMAHTNWNKPTVKLVVDGNGNVKLFASKTAQGELFEVVAVTGETGRNTSRLDGSREYSYNVTSQFNTVNWVKSGTNEVKISMISYDTNRFNGILSLKSN
ncbi:hypothetical protein [Sphingobacterium sp. MYb388]|uniref:hypothetical protein n=1 Tax=Sphingobacterium sp. MYb388 TaxID=2745437 RepID=UPI0030B5B6D1